MGAPTDQMALVEYSSPAEAATALSLNGMKIGDAFTMQVCWHVGVFWGAQEQQQRRGQVGKLRTVTSTPLVCVCLQPGLVSHGWAAVA